MNLRRVVEPVFNSAGEIFPLILLVVANHFVPLGIAFVVAIASYLVYLLFTLLVVKHIPSYMLVVCGVMLASLLIVFTPTLFRFISPESLTVVSEVLLIVIFSLSLLFGRFFEEREKQKKEKYASFSSWFTESLFVTRILRNVLIFHLLIVLIYKTLPDQYHSERLGVIIVPVLLLVFIFSVIIFETVRLSVMKQKINSEDWLSVVNETGGVIGKVALSVSMSSHNAYLHPVIRIVLLHKGLFYLCERSEHCAINPGKIDYPFEKFVFYKHSLEDAVDNLLLKVVGKKDLSVRFTFRYLFSSHTTKRLIYLYICKVDDEEVMNNLNINKGKLWTEKQIEENLGKNIFSECFEKEFQVLKNTVLMAEKIVLGQEPFSSESDQTNL